MGLNDLQSQINRLASKTSRQEAIIRDLQTKVAMAEQHAATTQQNLNSWAGTGGSGANPTAEISSLKVDGEATTFMRSDAAPPLKDTAVGAGSYTNSNITVDQQGRLTAASDGSAGGSTGGNPTAEISGLKVDGEAVTFMRSDAAPPLKDTAVTPGAYTSTDLTVDQQGRITTAASGSGGGGNPVVWGKLTGDFVTARMAGAAPPFGNAKWCTAKRQETNAVSNTLVEAEDVMVFTLGLHNAFHYNNSRVSMVKDDVFTAYKDDGKGWYRLTDSPISQEVYCRLKDHPWVDAEANHSWLGEYGSFYVYMNEKASTGDGSTPTLWNAAGTALVGNSDDEWDVRIRTGHALNAKDMYRGQFWPDEDLFIVDQIACIMAYVGAMAVTGSVGCFKWLDDPEDNNFYYPMGKRFNIIGQFEENVVKGETAKFMLGRWSQSSPEDGATPAAGDFEHETIFGTPATSHGSPVTWDITFEAGQVYNASSLTIQGDTTFNSGDVCACQYDESRGVYLAAPLRCS